ncbi:MAG TPA: serine hydrolase domain-containing protein [Rhizomicrobium sp.]|nr:serine hydrolase domain-containing protein [Rhizomicrobium sp.]
MGTAFAEDLPTMNLPTWVSLPVVALAATISGASAAPSTVLPDTAAGKLGGQLIAHINSDDAAHIRQWAPSILSPAVPDADKADFLKGLASAVRDSGGVNFVDARTQGPPGMLVLTIEARRTGQRAVLVLMADPAQPGKLAQAALFPIDDPAFYAAWSKGPVAHAEIARLTRDALDRLAREKDFSGCLSVVDGGETIFDECRGLAERNFATPVDRQTRFHIGSMDKMFTAIAIAQLVEAGKLSWNATLAELVPDYPDRDTAGKITVWQLLHHTAGLGDFFVPEFFRNREKFVDPADYLDLIARQPKVGEPGKDWNYSNAGYILLGRIVEKVSGENYFDYIQHHVFAPARMTASGFDAQEDVTPKLATGYFHDGVFSTVWKANGMTLPFKGSPAGGGYSTNADLLSFAKALKDGRLIKRETLTKMFDDEVPAGPGAYAAGFGDRLSSGRHIRGHQGGAPGMSADLAIVWETDAAIAVTSNEGESQTAMELAERIADLLAIEGAKQ